MEAYRNKCFVCNDSSKIVTLFRKIGDMIDEAGGVDVVADDNCAKDAAIFVNKTTADAMGRSAKEAKHDKTNEECIESDSASWDDGAFRKEPIGDNTHDA